MMVFIILKGFYTRTDNPAYNGPFETDVQDDHYRSYFGSDVIGPMAVIWFYQPFSNAGTIDSFFPMWRRKAIFNGSDQVSGY